MVKLIWGLIKAARPRQWIKNFAVFAGIIFAGELQNPSAVLVVFESFLIFCGLSSATYLINDVFDVERDRNHPFKKKRPIAAGIVPIPLAVLLSFGLIIILLPISYSISPALFYTALGYLILQVFYSAYLKSIILLDVMVIAIGFVLRIYAGVWVISSHVNVWFLLSIVSFALFIAIGKRRSELTLFSSAGAQRETLRNYSSELLDILTSMFANSTWLTYAIFVSLLPPINLKNSPFTEVLGNTPFPYIQGRYIMITVPIVIYGIMRYLYIIYEKKEGESPERVLLTDKPLLGAVVIWLAVVIFIMYYLGT